MKKILLSIASVVFAMNANAQVESAFVNPETVFEGIEETQWTDDKGKDQSGYPVEAGHFLCESDNVKMTIAYEEKGKISALAGESDNAKSVTIGGTVYKATTGVTGNSNPTATITEASTNGFVIQLDVKKDGFIYLICKLSSNKPYYVWEGKAGQQESLVAYTLTMHMLDETTALGEELNYTLPADADGYFDANAEDADKYVDGNVLRWPEKIVLGADAADIKKNGLGIVKFPVYADAGTYLFHATGSKVTIDGFVFSPTELDMKVNKVGEEPSEFDVWTVAGGSNLMGSQWDTADTSNDMKTTDGVTYTLVKEGVVLESGVTYEYKVAKDHAWTVAYPGENATLTVDETAIYTVTFTFNAETTEVSAVAEKTGEAVIGEKTYSVIGTINGNWDNDTDMTWDEENKFYAAVFNNVAAGSYQLKVRVNHDWSENYGGDGPDGNYVLDLAEEAATLFITFDPETKAVSHIIPGEVAINSVKAAKKFEGTIFNVAGQKVNASYKGLVIKNGKKYIQK